MKENPWKTKKHFLVYWNPWIRGWKKIKYNSWLVKDGIYGETVQFLRNRAWQLFSYWQKWGYLAYWSIPIMRFNQYSWRSLWRRGLIGRFLGKCKGWRIERRNWLIADKWTEILKIHTSIPWLMRWISLSSRRPLPKERLNWRNWNPSNKEIAIQRKLLEMVHVWRKSRIVLSLAGILKRQARVAGILDDD